MNRYYYSLVLPSMHLLTLSLASKLEESNLRRGDGNGTEHQSVARGDGNQTLGVIAAKGCLEISDTVRPITR
jgi:hypothetical protein